MSDTSLLGYWVRRFQASMLLRRVWTLMAGTGIAQIIQLSNLIVLANFYSLGDVGTYSVFLAVVGTIAPLALLGYEMLIPAVSEKELRPYLKAISFFPIPVGLLASGGCWLVGYDFWAAIVFWVVGTAIQRLGEMYNVRRNRFHRVAAARYLPALLMSCLLANLIVSGGSVADLINWQSVLVLVLGVLYTALSLRLRDVLEHDGWRAMLKTLRKSSNAPLFVMPSNVLNLLAYNVPVVVIGKWFGPDLAAQYAYVLRFGFGPVGLVGGALYQVFYGLLTEAARNKDPLLFDQFARARRHIFCAAIVAAVGIAIAYPLGFSLLLGEQWMTAGWISVIFAPFFGAMLYLTPLSVTLNTFNRQIYDLKTQSHYLIISIFSFGSAVLLQNEWAGFVLFSVLGCVRYAMLLRDIDLILSENGVSSNAKR